MKLTKDNWFIISFNERSIDILNNHVFCYDRGYARNRKKGEFHVLLMKPPHGFSGRSYKHQAF